MRIQLIVSDNQYSLIDDLKRKTGAATIKEVFNNALTLLEWAVRESTEGASICAIDGQKDRHIELQMPALCYAAHRMADPRKIDAQAAAAPVAAKGVGA